MAIEIDNKLRNEELLKLPITAFLCSRKIPAGAVLKYYDWGRGARRYFYENK